MSAEPTVKHEQEPLLAATSSENQPTSLPWPNSDANPQQYYNATHSTGAAVQGNANNTSSLSNQDKGAATAHTASTTAMAEQSSSAQQQAQQSMSKEEPARVAVSFGAATGSTHPNIHPQPGQPMDLHENGTLLQQFGAPTADSELPRATGSPPTSNVGQTVVLAQGAPPPPVMTPGMPLQVTQNGTQAMSRGVTEQNAAEVVRVATENVAMRSPAALSHQPLGPGVPKELRKPTRMPGTKQCPSCSGTIAAAVAKCPKCEHVFRAKKEKPKRSGKRGKKNCPKCQFENPSACSTCKSCKYVFRLKLMDRYKQMRPRAVQQPQQNIGNQAVVVSPVSLAHVQTAPVAPPVISSSSSLPMPSGVQQYHPQIQSHVSQPLHPAHAAHSAPLQALAPSSPAVAIHQQANTANVQAMLPPHQMHPHQTHPQL